MRTLEAKILDSTHLELREPLSLPPGRSIEISITADQIESTTRKGAAKRKPRLATDRAEAPGLSPPRRARELAWRSAHDDELQAYAGQWVVLEGEEIIAHGKDPAAAVERARSKGIDVPYVFYVEEYRPDVVLIGRVIPIRAHERFLAASGRPDHIGRERAAGTALGQARRPVLRPDVPQV